MELVPYTDEHRGLTEALELDPEVMKELGGPADPADLERVHRMRVETVARGEWYFTIVPEPSGPPVGSIGIWESTIAGSTIHEVGWMVLPEFQGRGIASQALGLLIAPGALRSPLHQHPCLPRRHQRTLKRALPEVRLQPHRGDGGQVPRPPASRQSLGARRVGGREERLSAVSAWNSAWRASTISCGSGTRPASTASPSVTSPA